MNGTFRGSQSFSEVVVTEWVSDSDRISSFNIAVQFHHWRTENFNSIQNSVPNYSNANYVPLQLDHFLTFTY